MRGPGGEAAYEPDGAVGEDTKTLKRTDLADDYAEDRPDNDSNREADGRAVAAGSNLSDTCCVREGRRGRKVAISELA